MTMIVIGKCLKGRVYSLDLLIVGVFRRLGPLIRVPTAHQSAVGEFELDPAASRIYAEDAIKVQEMVIHNINLYSTGSWPGVPTGRCRNLCGSTEAV